MSTVAELKSALSNIIYDHADGIWTEDDQISAAAKAFRVMDQEETRDEKKVVSCGCEAVQLRDQYAVESVGIEKRVGVV